jgi:hypothetical protein
MFLPRDFLLGESEQIEDCNIDPAKRWHKVVATTYPNKPGSDNQDGSRAAAEQAVAADGAAPRR